MKKEKIQYIYIRNERRVITTDSMDIKRVTRIEENTGWTLSDINHSNIFSDPLPRVMMIKTKINKWVLIKFKSFCTAKETLNKTERQHTVWKKIFAN